MNQKTISRIMIAGGVVAVLGILLVFGVFVPVIAGECKMMYPELSHLYWPGMIGMWLIGATYLLGLFEYFRVCARIGEEQSFSAGNVLSLRRIALYMALSGVLWIAAILAPPLVFHADLGPIWIYFVLFSMAGFALSLLAWGISHLLRRAAALQEENDLTV